MTLGALRGLKGPLLTPNLVLYLNSTSSLSPSNRTTVFLLFGGRSDPPNIYSTQVSTQPLAATYEADASVFNADYADLWLYVPAGDVWVRVGNTTCANPSLQCTDYTSVANLSAGAVPSLLTQLLYLDTSPVRPAQLMNRTLRMLQSTSALQQSLTTVLRLLLNTTAANDPSESSCFDTCANPSEAPAPTISSLSTTQCSAMNGGLISGGGAQFCNTTTSGLVISQLRPNSSEGHATAVDVVSTGLVVTRYYWQFGGFNCFSQGINIFDIVTWDATCLSQTLSVLDPTTLVWYSFSLPLQTTTQLLYWPSARVYASMAIDSSAHQIWVYGGATLQGRQWLYLNDLRIFDISTLQWLETSISGVSPVAGVGASLVWVPTTSSSLLSGIFLFGGCTDVDASAQFLQLQTSASLSAANWYASGRGLTQAVAGVPAMFSLTAESLSANNSFTGQLTYGVGLASLFAVTLYQINSEGSLVPFARPAVLEVGNGLYQVNYTLEYGSSYEVDIRYLQAGLTQTIRGSPFALTLLPSTYVSYRTQVVGTNYSQVQKNGPATITLQLVDAYGNEEISSASILPAFALYYDASVPIPSPSSTSTGNGTGSTTGTGTGVGAGVSSPSASNFAASTVSDNGDGTYTLYYTAPPLGTYYLYVYVDNSLSYGAPYTVTGLDPLEMPAAIQITFLILCAIAGAIVIALMIGIIVQRDNRVVRAGSPLFLVLICVGVLMCIASVPVYAYQTNATCRLFPFLLTTGYIVALSALFTKSWRVLLLFVSANLTTKSLTDATMLFPVFALLLCETVLNLCWLIADPLHLVTYDATSVLPYHACGGPHAVAFVSASVAFNGLIALWGVYIAVRIRNVPEAFNESKLMGAALYNLALMLLIAIPLTWTAATPQNSHEDFLIPAAAILWCCAVTVATTVAPKLYYVAYPPPASYFDAYPQQG